MTFPQKVDVYDRYPDQLTSTLSKIGGLLALLKFASLAIKEYHRRRFEKLLSQSESKSSYSIQDSDALIEENAMSFKDLFTYKNLLETLK